MMDLLAVVFTERFSSDVEFDEIVDMVAELLCLSLRLLPDLRDSSVSWKSEVFCRIIEYMVEKFPATLPVTVSAISGGKREFS